MGAVSSVVDAVSDTVSDIGSVVVDTVSNVVDTTVDVWHDVSEPLVDTQLGRLALNVATGGQAAPVLAAYDISQGADPTKAITNAALSYAGSEFISPEISAALGGDAAANIAADALVGGTKSAIQGGDFLTGAAIGGVYSGIDEAKLAAAEDYLQSIEPGAGYDANPITQEQIDEMVANLPPSETAIATPVITPEITPIELPPLSTNDLLAQITGVQTGLESQLTAQGQDFMDYLQQQGLDYETALNEAITAQGSEFGTALNQTTEDILAQIAEQGTGLQTEFQTGLQGLADQLGISQQELQDQLNQLQEDWGTELSGLQTGIESQLSNVETSLAESTLANKLAMLDAMKAIGGLGLSITGINNVMQAIQDQVTPKTFEYTPIDTSGWKSPVAAQPVNWNAPAPINFGSPELLKGTQWESPINLSQVINTMNANQPAPFVAPDFMSTFQYTPTVGTSDIIGELGGRPVSIADIVEGIQSGQNYSS